MEFCVYDGGESEGWGEESRKDVGAVSDKQLMLA
jgi:hypothetical protein